MKRAVAALSVTLLLLLSGCRPDGTHGGSTTVPTPPPTTTAPGGESPDIPPTPTPTPTPASPAPTESTPPAQSTPPGESAPPEETPAFLTAEELAILAQEWQLEYADRFAGYDAFRTEASHWFANYTGQAQRIAFTPSDGVEGDISFLPMDDLTDPSAAAALLLGQEPGSLILVDRAALDEKVPQRMAAMAEKNLTRAAALDYFLRTAKTVPALAEEMWYCVSAEDVGYILMRHGDAYRLQRMAAMLEYAETPELRVHVDFAGASTAWGWFHTAPLPLAGGEGIYRTVEYPGLTSMLELRTCLKLLFSDEIVDALLGLDYYKETDGVLCGRLFPPDEPLPTGEVTVTVESPTRMVYTSGADYVYELVGERWLFTQFPVAE